MTTVAWREVKERIDREVGAIWLDEPIEAKKLRYGVVPSQAGSDNQYFSTWVFAFLYTLALGKHTIYDLLKATDESSISLDALKTMTRMSLAKGLQPTEFLGYIGIATEILDVLDSLESREAYRELVGSYFTYLNILHWWIHLGFPWYIGLMFPQMDRKTIDEIDVLMANSMRPRKEQAYERSRPPSEIQDVPWLGCGHLQGAL